MAVYGIAHVQIPIPSGREDEARSFYGSVLGMLEIPKRESLSDRGGVWFECGDQQLHCGVENAASDTRRHAALLTDDLDKSERNLSGGGFEITSDREIPGYRRCTRAIPSEPNRTDATRPGWTMMSLPSQTDTLRRLRDLG
jgi:catechol 2,3-dioxygenase-like lactoylglutathione lyase family enzyme